MESQDVNALPSHSGLTSNYAWSTWARAYQTPYKTGQLELEHNNNFYVKQLCNFTTVKKWLKRLFFFQ